MCCVITSERTATYFVIMLERLQTDRAQLVGFTIAPSMGKEIGLDRIVCLPITKVN